MAKPESEHRRKKRSSSSRRDAPSSWSLPLVLSACFILSLLIASSNDNKDSLTQHDDALSSQQEHRRFLLLDEDQVLDVGLEENVWHRQLRARKGRERRQLRNNNKGAAWSRMAAPIDGGGNVMEDGGGRRMAVDPIPRYADKHHFEECIGKSIEECQTLIDTFVTANPDQFNNQTTLMLDIRKIRELTDDSYYKVVLTTNLDGDKISGIMDDGMIYYPWPWRVEGEDTTIGPWDCHDSDADIHLSPAECCQMIQGDVNYADDNGNFMACFVEEPVGSLKNPDREDRAITVINAKGKVVRAPVAH